MNLKKMKQIADNSDHRRYHHAALIFAGGRLLSYGYNTRTQHAEVSAINRLWRLYRPGNSRPPSNLHLVSFMVKKHGNCIGNSEPCLICRQAIRIFGVRRISYYKNGKMIQEYL